jgi:hypothetical protein
MSPAPRVTIGMTTYNNRSRLGGAFDDLLVLWWASRVHVRIGAWRQQIGARCAGSTRTAVG